MNVIKRLAPNYWLGYYAVYMVTLGFLLARHRHEVLDGTGSGYLLTLAAIFGVSLGMALTSAIISEGVGYVVLLIPKRIKKLKAEGRKEGRKEGRQEGRREERKKARKRAGEARKRAGEAVARFEKGEISIAELRRLVADQDDASGQD